MKKNLFNVSLILIAASLFLAGKQVTKKEAAENPIVIENKKKGTKDWMLTKVHSDTCLLEKPYRQNYLCRQQDIEGYCSHTSIKSGETLNVFVSTNPASSFTVDIYRMGYYGGMGGRKMMSIGPIEGHMQATPDDGEKNLRDCQWTKSFEIKIPADWLSGVYLGKMTATKSGMQSYIIFIVKDDRKTDLLFQCSDFTWQSYNRWPAWRSGYDWYFKNGEHNPWNSDPGPEISFNRPYTFYYNALPIGPFPPVVGSGEFLLWEFPLAFWMESKGYDVSYISNMDVHLNAQELMRAKGFLSVGHDEYWTRKMYENVTAARDAGVNLLFLSGNAISGEVYFKPDGKGIPNRVFGRIQRYKDEDKLLGGKSYGVGLASWKCDMPDHWIFDGTGMKKGDTIKDLVGWEYHGFPLANNPGMKVVATGPMIESDSGALYASTIYDGPKGNFVFDAATCWWNMLLSTPPLFPKTLNPYGAYHGHPIDFTKPDTRVQRMTENLLNRAAR